MFGELTLIINGRKVTYRFELGPKEEPRLTHQELEELLDWAEGIEPPSEEGGL